MTLWLVRAGENGEREQTALEKKLAIVGWDRLPDLSVVKKRELLTELLETQYPDKKKNTLTNWESQLWPFVSSMQIGDLVAMPSKTRSIIHFGNVTGDYKYEPGNPPGFRHTRPVYWEYEIPRNQIEQDLLYSLGAFMAVCKIQRNDAERRIKALLSDKPGKPVGVDKPRVPIGEEPEIDIEQFARDQISQTITRNFKGHKLTHLTAAVLEAQGYKLRISPEGPDGGVDIIAGKGPLGFESPRLVVQVKSSDSPVDVKVFRELNGVMDSFGAESGLIVAWGGFRGAVAREAARHYFKIRLWGPDDLVQMVQENYDRLPEYIQSDLPLKRIWILMLQDEE